MLGGELMLWWDAADIETLLFGSGKQVSQWMDKASGYPVAQATGTRQPRWVSNGLNGLPALSFVSGNLTNLQSGNLPLPGTWTVFCVWTPNVVNINQEVFVSFGGTLGNYGLFIYCNSVGGSFSRTYNSAATLFNSPSTTLGSAFPIIQMGNHSGTQIQGAINGAVPGSTAFSGTTRVGISQCSIGSSTGGTSNPVNGYISEILFTRVSLSSAEIAYVTGYLAWKWGLQTKLPSTHPFRYSPP